MKIKIISVVFFTIIVVSTVSCGKYRKFHDDREVLLNEKKQRKENKKKDKEESTVLVDTLIQVEQDSLLKVKEIGDSLYMSYERTACYGRCPIYKIRIFDSGFTTYEGINFVERMGMYHTRLNDSVLADIEKKLTDIDFYHLDDEYNNKNISDLPGRIFVVNTAERQKRVVGKYEVPEKLIGLFDHMEHLIDKIEWKPGD